MVKEKEINIMRFNKPNMIQGLMKLISDVNIHFEKNIEMIEVGSYIGESTMMFEKFLTAKKIHCIDMWGVTDKYTKSEINKAENVFDMLTKKSEIIKKHKTHSRNERLKSIGKVDFVYIDASHHYEDVKADIAFYLPFLVEGGIIAGHDFSPKFEGVIKAVAESFPNSNVVVYEDTSWLVKL
jgi:predicted O-methyltransferase YrrM